MNATTKNNENTSKLAWSMAELQQALSCGRSTAEKIGTAAGARMKIGKRVLYNVKKIEEYLNSISE